MIPETLLLRQKYQGTILIPTGPTFAHYAHWFRKDKARDIALIP